MGDEVRVDVLAVEGALDERGQVLRRGEGGGLELRLRGRGIVEIMADDAGLGGVLGGDLQTSGRDALGAVELVGVLKADGGRVLVGEGTVGEAAQERAVVEGCEGAGGGRWIGE